MTEYTSCCTSGISCFSLYQLHRVGTAESRHELLQRHLQSIEAANFSTAWNLAKSQTPKAEKPFHMMITDSQLEDEMVGR